MLIAVIVVFVLLPCLLLTMGLCKVAARADRESDDLYDSLTQAEAPTVADAPRERHPSIERALGRAD